MLKFSVLPNNQRTVYLYTLGHFAFKQHSPKKINPLLACLQGMLKLRKKTSQAQLKSNTEMPALKVTALTMKYLYVPELSDVLHLSEHGADNYLILYWDVQLKYFCCQHDHQANSLINKSTSSDSKWCNTKIEDLMLHSYHLESIKAINLCQCK